MSDSEHTDEPPRTGVEWFVPPEEEAGAHAENVAIWFTPYGFVLDFAEYQLPQLVDAQDPSAGYVTPMRVVSRVRIPAGLAFDMIKTITAKMDEYESVFGKIWIPEITEGDDSQ